jgi:pyrimidine deaminase RibD-like protein
MDYKREADKVVGRNYRHVAIVHKGGRTLSIGNNVSRHAEVAALSKLKPADRKGTTVFSARIRHDGSFANGRPCEKCWDFLLDNGVKKVAWSNSDGTITEWRL